MNYSFDDIKHVKALVKTIFSTRSANIERVAEGVSTCVYRVICNRETFYLRILPEERQSFAPEVLVHQQLRQMGVRVPDVLYFEHYHEPLQRSVVVTSEIKGKALSQSSTLSHHELDTILREAGRDIAHVNSIPVDGFGWVQRNQPVTTHLRAALPTFRAFALEYWDADIAYFAEHAVLSFSEIMMLERIRSNYDSWLDETQAYLAHGDFDTTHIFQDSGHYTGIIDFGEIRGTNRLYDVAQFHMRDDEYLPYKSLLALLHGYEDVSSLPYDYKKSIYLTSLFTNIRALARSLQKRPPNRYTKHRLEMLRQDLTTL